MIRSARPRLADIDDNITVILTRVAGRSFEDLTSDLDLRYVTLHALMIIAEAVKNLPAELTVQHPHIPWNKVVGTGTKIKHEYHRIDLFIVWDAIANHLPELQSAIQKLILTTKESV